ncbi:MAG: hypothetical protein JRF33_17885, partial [Deltaproteobacteria bacterium]|nr:hypothetical protein [Deltaproteobacteria bacterium]
MMTHEGTRRWSVVTWGTIVLLGCVFEPTLGDPYYPCEENGTCLIDACVCIGDRVCVPKDKDANPGICAPCRSDSDCDDGDPCTRDECRDWRCVYVLQNIPGAEGPAGDPTCSNGMDDDCDGLTDSEDSVCAPVYGFCTQFGWCWEHPLPQGNDLFDILALAADDVWAVGQAGTILHWDGESWSMVPSGVEDSLLAIHGVAGDLWAVGSDGLILHQTQPSGPWAVVPSGTTQLLAAVWRTAEDDVWSVGYGGVILHWDGEIWSAIDSGTTVYLRGIWGLAPDDVWVVGNNGTVLRWDGVAWQVIPDVPDRHLPSVWGSDSENVWVCGTDGLILNWDGTSWLEVPSGTENHITSIWGLAPDDIWATARYEPPLHWAGSAWSFASSERSAGISAIAGTSAEHLWAVGWDGLILRWDDTDRVWSSLSSASLGFIYDVWGFGETEVWAVGVRGRILRRSDEDRMWSLVPSGS